MLKLREAGPPCLPPVFFHPLPKTNPKSPFVLKVPKALKVVKVLKDAKALKAP